MVQYSKKGGVKVKKQILLKHDIQKELLTKLNKLKVVSIFLTVIVIIGMILYPIHLINYLNDTPFDYTGGLKSPDLTPKVAIFVIPILIILFALIVLYIYYIDLYNIKKGNFRILEEKLCQKENEWRHYYKHSEKENSLYFNSGRVTVEKEVYSCSDIGDTFYIVILKSKRNPQLAYHTKYYEMSNS